MPTTTTHIITDLPPAYSPSTSPAHVLSERAADRGNYAFAIMQHTLWFNTDAAPSRSNAASTVHSSRRSRPPTSTQRSTRLSTNVSKATTMLPTPPSSRRGSPVPHPHPLPTPPPSPPPTQKTSRAQRAALRDFHATQDPALWGRRVGHGRQARLIQNENQGFWAWLGKLLVDEDRGRALVMSAGSPWGLMGPPGHV